MNGYRYRRFEGSNNSARHASHVATSGQTKTSDRSPTRLGSMRKPTSPRHRSARVETDSTRASGGGLVVSARSNRSSASRSPSTSMTTPAGLLVTKPLRWRWEARPCTNGRKPTPWTTPWTEMARRSIKGSTAPLHHTRKIIAASRRVAERVADQMNAEHGDRQRESGKERHPPRGVKKMLPLVQQRAPRHHRGVTQPEKAHARFDENRAARLKRR